MMGEGDDELDVMLSQMFPLLVINSIIAPVGKGTWENAEGLFRKLSEDGATSEADLTSIQRGLR